MEFNEFAKYFNIMVLAYLVGAMGWYFVFKAIGRLMDKWHK
ncbi:hypothetical protein [Anaerovibrio lipolyticus]|jgi:hypothetical protein|nr:hypothetical protein [Anaerovibrio lipolyticus]